MLLLDPHSAAEPDNELRSSSQLALKMGGKLLTLPPGKTKVAIGSSPRCDVRLQEAGVQPLHCLIDLNSVPALVRRWAGKALLNGQPFEESQLTHGDRLQIGQFEIEIVDRQHNRLEISPPPSLGPKEPPSTDHVPLEGTADISTTNEPSTNTIPRDDATSEELLRQIATLQEQVAQAQSDRSETLAELLQIRTEFAQLQLEASELKAVSANQKELAEQVESLQREQQAIVATLLQREEQNAALTSQNHQLIEELSRVRQEAEQISQLANEWNEERETLCEQLAKLQEELRAVGEERAKLAEELRAAFAERDELSRQRDQLQSDWHRQSDELSAQNQQLLEELSRVRQEADEMFQRTKVLDEERDKLLEQVPKLEDELQAVAQERSALSEALTAASARYDEMCRRIEQLQFDLQHRSDELTARLEELSAIRNERDHLRLQYDQLESTVRELNDRLAAQADEQAALTTECESLRQKVHRLDELESQLRQAVTERENTSAELYRALLQLAEMQDRDEQHIAFAAAHQALKEELEKSVGEVALLQSRVSQLLEEHAAVENTRQALLDQLASLNTVQQELTQEKNLLASRLAEVQQELSSTARQRDEYHQRLIEAEAVRCELIETRQGHEELAARVTELECELAEASNRELAQSRRIAELEEQLASAEAAVTAAAASASPPATAENETVAFSEAQLISPPSQTELGTQTLDSPSSVGTPSVSPNDGDSLAGYEIATTVRLLPTQANLPNEGELEECPNSEIATVPKDECSGCVSANVVTEQSSATISDTPDASLLDPQETRKTQNASSVCTAEEESLEEYVAKLLQRIRGESSSAASSPSATAASEPKNVLSGKPPESQETPTTAPPAGLASEEVASETLETGKTELVRRRPMLPESTADLAALRTLANESARRAITTHTLRKHRHNAVTRSILAVVAGMASWWFFSQAKDWISWHFIAGSLSLLGASYWLGETLRTLFLWMRVVASDRYDKDGDCVSALDSEATLSELESSLSAPEESLDDSTVESDSISPERDLELC